MELRMKIRNIKNIKNLEIELPLNKGLYAITGENASGKSTIVACASASFFKFEMDKYFGMPDKDSEIIYEIGETEKSWVNSGGSWFTFNNREKLPIRGFYEGSLLFGNRFKDAAYSLLTRLDNISKSDLCIADSFVSQNLGYILHNDINFYKNLFILKPDATIGKELHLNNRPYFFITEDGKVVSQARMSTGEYLLLNILHSLLSIKKKITFDTHDKRMEVFFLDEIEFALHPSALRRLINTFNGFLSEYDLCVYFSTHSIELIRNILPSNIFYIQKLPDGTPHIINPCYPAFATRSLYDDDGYGYDFVVFVEDDVAKLILDEICSRNKLCNSKRVKVIPTGGWANTLLFAYDIQHSNMMTKDAKLIVILDRDIKSQVPGFLGNHKECRSLTINYLPINSLEKYLKNNLVDKTNARLFDYLNSYLFIGKPLSSVIDEYSKQEIENDKDGKKFYNFLGQQLQVLGKNRSDIVKNIVTFLFDNEKDNIAEITDFLSKNIR